MDSSSSLKRIEDSTTISASEADAMQDSGELAFRSGQPFKLYKRRWIGLVAVVRLHHLVLDLTISIVHVDFTQHYLCHHCRRVWPNRSNW